jgi:hypothetical protein
MLSNEELREGLATALTPVRGEAREKLLSSLIDVINEQKSRSEGIKAIDESLFGEPAAYAFHWEDVLAVSEAVESAFAVIVELPPAEAALMLLCMVEFWHRLRRNRIPLSRSEYLVLGAIQRGNRSKNAIEAATGLDGAVVEDTLTGLKSRMYRVETPLVDGDEGGYVTSF